ncbi:MAG: pilus assembly protein [Deltaproteobacteria bacterium]|jgi:uncharacterized Ntn-hydrolase superfamily protein|nr:pilus assembly protein [Deltaproteobacteria bacterium]
MTYSIIIRDPEKNHFGIAVATKHLAVGSRVPFLEAGVGAVATQSATNPYLGLKGLASLRSGEPIESALGSAIAADDNPESRQLHGLDKSGNFWAWTGTNAQSWAGHIGAKNVSVAGNFLAGPGVLKACMESLQFSTDRSLESRLLQALFAGEEAGGDIRGRQSAALITIRDQPFPWCNLRVDDNPDPLVELIRLFEEFKKPYYQNFISPIR